MDSQIDLFDQFDKLPKKVQAALNSFDENGDLYKECNRVLKEINKLGYTYEYYLDGTPYNLTKLTNL